MSIRREKEKNICTYDPFEKEWKCNRPLYDDNFCIFHSNDIEKKAEFNKLFSEELERQKKYEKSYNFSGFVFPDSMYFSGFVFDKKTDFSTAKFKGEETLFNGAKFLRDTSFFDVTFQGRASFFNVFFKKNVNFKIAKFKGSTDFNYTKFSGGAEFIYAQFLDDTIFNNAIFFGRTDFEHAYFSFEVDFKKIKINETHEFRMVDTYFWNVNGLLELIDENKKGFKFSKTNRAEFLPDNFKLILGDKAKERYPIISRMIRDDIFLMSFKKKHPILHFFWWLFADCGRSIWRWIIWSLFFALYFAINYFLIDYSFPSAFQFSTTIQHPTIWSYIYYSVVTFTTLGFGDIVPTAEWVQRWVMAEVITGYIMLGGLISILANKLARRS
jgi:hypothetical protein